MARLKPILALLIVLPTILAGIGCEDQPIEATPLYEAAPVVRLSPGVGGLGMSIQLELRGTNTQWVEGQVSIDLGLDILVAGVTVVGPNHATADIQILETATLGFRDVSISYTGAEGQPLTTVLEGDDGFLVEPGGIQITPNRARLGETLQVEVLGFNTILQDGSTWADFGDGIFVNWMVVHSPTTATVSISIDQRADPGDHDVVVFNGPTGYTLMDGFFVDRSSVCIEIDPAHGNQGEVLPFVVQGCDTHFSASGNKDTLIDMGTSICVNEYWPDCQDTVEPGGVVDVLTTTQAQGTMRISNGAMPGLYDVRAYTVEREDFDESGTLDPGEFTILEEVILHEGFEVREVPVNCIDNPGVSFGFSVSRNIDNDTCGIQESVGASAVFFTPLDPPCGSPPMDPVFPFDINYIRNPPAGNPDCPSPRTCDAGPYVYLVSDQNTVTLARDINSFTGEIRYAPTAALSIDDYKFGYVGYDLVIEGSDDPTQIPAYTQPQALFTLPSDFDLIEPTLCENYTHNPDEDLNVLWTPAQTYDVAGLSMSYSTSDAEGNPWMVITIPWDDGEHPWESSNFSQLPEGGGYFSIGAGVGEPKWFFDFGNGAVGVENQGGSGLSYRGFMSLRRPEEGADGSEE
jgi:hypothetical protein